MNNQTWRCIALAALAAIGERRSTTDFHIAPMQCYTNQSMRRLFDSLSPTSVKWTEMEKAQDLLPNVQTSLEKRLGEHDKNLVLQLGSNDPHHLEQCVETAVQHHGHQLREINLNCGCPAIDAGGAPTYGASLMKDASLTAKLVQACRSTIDENNQHDSNKMNVSVKCRIAVFDHADDLRPLREQDYDYLHHYITSIEEAGANHVTLHARPAVLTGLSPVKNRIVPNLQYDFCQRIARDFPNLVVTLNGGISGLDQFKSHCDDQHSGRISSFMAGRWILRRPLDLVCVEEILEQQGGASQEQQTQQIADRFSIVNRAIEDYLSYCTKSLMAAKAASTVSTAELLLPLYLVVEQLKEDYNSDDCDDYGDDLLSFDEMEDLHDILQDGVMHLTESCGKRSKGTSGSSINFKRLSTLFKPLVGTKVVNKWKRNRAEL